MTTQLQSPTLPTIQRSDGITPAEQYLKTLCDKSFLSMWSYPGIYRDQGNTTTRGDGKEICDLLVVFKEHILIFSDKDCSFPATDDIQLDWSRWYRRAIKKSAEQVWGAERWILSHPNRLFLDRACTIPFPIDLPSRDIAKIHRIVVAHAVSERCAAELGGSGSLMVMPRIIGDMHCNTSEEGNVVPFAIGQIDPDRGYIHVFDDTTLDIMMDTLDTITDFVEYLSKKEQFINSGKLASAAGEEELLAEYLSRTNSDNRHDFVYPSAIDRITLAEGFWERFTQSPQRKAQLKANEISYSWDRLIETFSLHIFAGTSQYASHPSLNEQEKIFRILANEPRLRRRQLAKNLLELIGTTPKPYRTTRTIPPVNPDDPCYIFLLLPDIHSKSHEEYREVRRELLYRYCMVTKLDFPFANDIIGIATESGRAEIGSEDIVYLDGRLWTSKEQTYAQQIRTELKDSGLLRDRRSFVGTEKEYPDPPDNIKPVGSIRPKMKGNQRNTPCPCGSGRKFKKCCGRWKV